MEIIDLKDIYSPKDTTIEEAIKIRDYFIYYDMLEKGGVYPFKLVNKWVYQQKINKKTKGLGTESYTTVKMVDEFSFHCLYGRLFNPVILNINKSIEDEEDKFTFSAMVLSIDDSAYGVIKRNMTYAEIDVIRNKFFEYLEKTEIIYVNDFVDFGVELGLENNNW